MKRFAWTLAAAALLCAAAGAKAVRSRGLFTGTPGMNVFTTMDPGTTKPLARPYPGAPPLIPHAVYNLTIKRDVNDCLTCHLEGMEVAEGHSATRIPPSHLDGAAVKGIRYQCRQCHVPQDTLSRPPVAQAR